MRFVQSPYFVSRNGKNIQLIVIHTMVGYYESTINYFQNNQYEVSAHYLVKEDGSEVCQMVDEAWGANHAGIISNPNPLYYKGFNPNWNSIGIECADNRQPHDWDRSLQYSTIASLVRDICTRRGIPIDREHICGHRELRDTKTCPGNLDVNKIVELAKGGESGMDDITKNAIDILTLALKEFGYGNLEGTARGIVQAQRDLVKVQTELKEYKDGEEIRIKTAVDSALTINNKDWQLGLDTANKKIEELTKKVEELLLTQAERQSYSTLFSIAFRKLWIFRRGGE